MTSISVDDPLYKPESWVVFNINKSIFFGQIIGGNSNNGGWYYIINNPQGTVYMVKEEDISHELSQ